MEVVKGKFQYIVFQPSTFPIQVPIASLFVMPTRRGLTKQHIIAAQACYLDPCAVCKDGCLGVLWDRPLHKDLK